MAARDEFIAAEQRMLAQYGIDAESRFVDVPSIGGRAHVLISGHGPAALMLSGIGTPGAMWAPLMAELDGLRLLAVDLPGYGLTDTTPRLTEQLRESAVRFLEEVLDALALERVALVANSLGSLWASWLALDFLSGWAHWSTSAARRSSSTPQPPCRCGSCRSGLLGGC